MPVQLRRRDSVLVKVAAAGVLVDAGADLGAGVGAAAVAAGVAEAAVSALFERDLDFDFVAVSD